MKKIRRTRIRTETKRLVFIQEQTAAAAVDAAAAHEICPTCGQPVVALENPSPSICAELHTDEQARFRLEKTGETE